MKLHIRMLDMYMYKYSWSNISLNLELFCHRSRENTTRSLFR